MHSRYSPFPDKELSQIAAKDLAELSSVSEGWYVEYKREIPKAKAVAKSISAFANTYGGWLFFGVEESSKSDNVAGSCPGIPRAEMDTALQAIRQSAASHLNPIPHFDSRVVWGPNVSMGLSKDHGVICIETRQSAIAPHVHSSGMIYRRISDSSEPKAENDPHQLELLWNRREKIHAEYERWIEREPELSEGEGNRPYLRLLLEADLYRAKDQLWDLSIDEIKDTLNDTTSGTNLPLENIYPSSLGVVARQTSSLNHHEAFGITWIIGRGLQCEIWLPLNVFFVDEPYQLQAHLEKYQNTERFIGMLKSSNANTSRILDLNQVLLVLIATSNMYLNLLAKAGINTKTFHAKIILNEVWRTIPFVDSETMLNRIDKHGLPLCINNVAMLPRGTDADSFCEVLVNEESQTPDLRGFDCATVLFELTCRALGLQGFLADESDHEVVALYTELFAAWERSSQAE